MGDPNRHAGPQRAMRHCPRNRVPALMSVNAGASSKSTREALHTWLRFRGGCVTWCSGTRLSWDRSRVLRALRLVIGPLVDMFRACLTTRGTIGLFSAPPALHRKAQCRLCSQNREVGRRRLLF